MLSKSELELRNTVFTRNDYKILMTFYDLECTTEMKSLTVYQIRKKTQLSVSKIRQTLRKFKVLGLVAEGVLAHKAKTYYLTDNGKKQIKSVI